MTPFFYGLNVRKAGSIVKPFDNQSKNDCMPIQWSKKVKECAAFWRLGRKTPRGVSPVMKRVALRRC